MPAPLFKRIDLDKIYPAFLEKLLQAVASAQSQGAHYYATSGYRSPEEQLKLWQQGRNAAGAVVAPKKVVTKVKFGLHNLGLAVDFCRDANLQEVGLQPAWEVAGYKALADAAQAHDLEAGFYWKTFQDPPHVQLPIGKHGLTITKLKALHDKGGLKGVWSYLDGLSW